MELRGPASRIREWVNSSQGWSLYERPIEKLWGSLSVEREGAKTGVRALELKVNDMNVPVMTETMRDERRRGHGPGDIATLLQRCCDILIQTYPIRTRRLGDGLESVMAGLSRLSTITTSARKIILGD